MEIGGLRSTLTKERKNKEKEVAGLEKSLTDEKKDKEDSIAQLREDIKELRLELAEARSIAVAAFKKVDDLEEELRERDDYLFKIFRGNLLMDLIKKLLPEEVNKATPRSAKTKWTTLAENFGENDFKKATRDYNVSKDSAQVMELFKGFHLVSLVEKPKLFAVKSSVY